MACGQRLVQKMGIATKFYFWINSKLIWSYGNVVGRRVLTILAHANIERRVCACSFVN